MWPSAATLTCVPQRGRADRGRRWQLDDERAERVGERQQDLDAGRRLVERDRLGQLDALAEGGVDGRRAELGVGGADRGHGGTVSAASAASVATAGGDRPRRPRAS